LVNLVELYNEAQTCQHQTISLHLPTYKITTLCVINQVKYPENSTAYRLMF